MTCNPKESQRQGDCLEARPIDSLLGQTASGWLIEQAIVCLNDADECSAHRYRQIIEILGDRKDSVQAVMQLAQTVDRSDVPLRWSLLYVLGEIGDPDAARFLLRTAVEPLPGRHEHEGCEGPRDNELLIRIMAIEAFENIAGRFANIAERVVEAIDKKVDRAVLIEVVKIAVRLGLRERIEQMLEADDRWILDLRTVKFSELDAVIERGDSSERGFTPPVMQNEYSSPQSRYVPPQSACRACK